MTATGPIKTLVCFDNPVLQAGLMAILGRHGDLDCMAGSGPTPLHNVAAHPDVIVADYACALACAAAVARRARPDMPTQVLIVTQSDRECDIRTALAGGVQGYLLMDEAHEHLAAAVRAVRPGARILSPRAASRLAENVAQDPLTRREEAVLGLVIEGLCNKSIGSRLGITSGTVKSHLRSAFSKLGAESRTQAVAIAHRRGLFELPASAVRAVRAGKPA